MALSILLSLFGSLLKQCVDFPNQNLIRIDAKLLFAQPTGAIDQKCGRRALHAIGAHGLRNRIVAARLIDADRERHAKFMKVDLKRLGCHDMVMLEHGVQTNHRHRVAMRTLSIVKPYPRRLRCRRHHAALAEHLKRVNHHDFSAQSGECDRAIAIEPLRHRKFGREIFIANGSLVRGHGRIIVARNGCRCPRLGSRRVALWPLPARNSLSGHLSGHFPAAGIADSRLAQRCQHRALRRRVLVADAARFYYATVRRAERKLVELATRDSLTGLSNRRNFLALAKQEMARARRSGEPIALIIADIDFFKQINDERGHYAGDHVIAHAAELMLRVCRSPDIVARWGGEEFLLLLPATTPDAATALAERIRHSHAETEGEHAGAKIKYSLSLGVAALALDESINHAIARADQAMYQSKAAGRNRVTEAG